MVQDANLDITQKIMSITPKQGANFTMNRAVKQPSEDTTSVTLASDMIGTTTPQTPQLPQHIPATPHLHPLSRQAQRLAIEAQAIQEQCRRLYLSVFFRDHAPARSLGFTGTVAGEGKTFLAMVTANILATDSHEPVVLLECNWEHPCLHEHFGLAPAPGLAEWLRGECDKASIIHQVLPNLSVIPAGNGKQDAIHLLQHIHQQALSDLLALTSALLVVDLPAIAPAAYGLLAASLVESLVVVVRSGVTSDALIAETCSQIKNLPVEGVVLNQIESRIPRWLRSML